jgi:sec-independent protein translocase protein TatA
LAIEGYEALSIVLILVVLFIWGPQKLPEMAKAIGEAKREFERAAREMSSAASATVIPTNEVPYDPIITAAKSLGISTEGKTKPELTKEILDRTAAK